MDDLVKSTRSALTRAELPGMSLMEHLEELRKRLIHSAIYLAIGFVLAYYFREGLYGFVQAPLDQLHIPLNFTHPTDGLMLYLKTAFAGGAILASPFILFQIWLFISPGMYSHEKRYVWPFMSATVGLFLAGAYWLPLGFAWGYQNIGYRLRPPVPSHPYHRRLYRLLPVNYPGPRRRF